MSFATVIRRVPPGQGFLGRYPGLMALRYRLRHFMMVAGPGLIVMVADNDAGAISTYTQAGALYGNSLLWVLLLLLPVTHSDRPPPS